MRIVAIMKSNESFKRVRFQIDSKKIEWEEPIKDLDDIREKIPFIKYDLAVIDDNIWWKDEAIELFKKFDTEILNFEGDFEKIAKVIMQKIPDDKPTEEEKKENIKEPKEDDLTPIRYIEKEKIVEKQIKVKVPVYTEVYTNIPKQLIVIANLSKRAGATFITLNLAKALSELKILSSIIEPPIEKPYIFDTVGLEIKLNKTNEEESLQFYSYPHVINEEQKIEREKETIEEGIIWLIPDSRKQLINSWDYYKMMKLLYSSRKASISILDIGSNIEHESIKPILDEADKIFIIIDPMPAEIMQNHKLLDSLLEAKRKGSPIDFIINRWTSGINKKELMRFIKVNPIALIPNIETEYIHKAVYNCSIPYSLKEIKEQLEIPLDKVIKKIIPSEFLKTEINKDTETTFKNKLFSKFRKEK